MSRFKKHFAECVKAHVSVNFTLAIDSEVTVKPDEIKEIRDRQRALEIRIVDFYDQPQTVEATPEELEEMKQEAEAAKLAACQTLDWVIQNNLTALEPEARAAKTAACQTLEWICLQLPPTP